MRRRTSCRSSTRRRPTSTTLTDDQRSLDTLLLSAVGFSQTGINVIGTNESNIVRSMNLLDPTTALLQKYSPTFTCLFQGAQWYVEHGGRETLGGNGYSFIMDAALLFGDDPYRYPRTPSEGECHRRSGGQTQLWFAARPERELPGAPTGHRHRLGRRSGRDPHQSMAVGNPWWANYFPTTKNPPEPPRYFYRGGAAAAMKRRKLSGIIARVALFTAICLVFTFALIAVFGQLRFEDRTGYHAVFTNISGLKSGNFVRIAGVEVGKVGDLTLHRDGTVTVGFAVDKGVRLTEGTKAVVRYENLIGDRYLALEDGPGPPRRLPPGATIPLARTSPAWTSTH